MKRLLLAILLASGLALAGGRAACRITYGPPPFYSCFAEHDLINLGLFNVALGVESRSWPNGVYITPYVLFAYYGSPWVAFQMGRDLTSGWMFALSGGMSW